MCGPMRKDCEAIADCQSVSIVHETDAQTSQHPKAGGRSNAYGPECRAVEM